MLNLLLLLTTLASTQDIKALKKQWVEDGSLQAKAELVQIADSHPRDWTRYEALHALGPACGRPDLNEVVRKEYDALMRLAERHGKGDNDLVRGASGNLGQALQHWMNHDSPGALAIRAAYEGKQRRLKLAFRALQLFMVLLVLMGIGAALLARGGIAWLFFGRTLGVPVAGPAFRKLIKSSPAFLLMPVFSWAMVAVAVGAVIWRTMTMDVPAWVRESEDATMAYVVVALLDWRVVLAYFIGGFSQTFLQSVMVYGIVAQASRGRAPWLAEAWAAALRRLGTLMLLSILTNGLLYVLHLGALKLRSKIPKRVPWGRWLIDTAAWLAGVQASLAGALAAGLVTVENLSVKDAFRRSAEQIEAGGKSGELLRLAGAASIASNGVKSAVAICLFGGACAGMFFIGDIMPFWEARIHDSRQQAVALLASYFFSGVIGAIMIYSLTLVAQAVLAAEAILPDHQPIEPGRARAWK